jgi:hypothetical protein
MQRLRCTGLALMLVCIAVLTGCKGGDERLAISGTVSYKGNPIQEGSIEFVPHPGVKTQSGGPITNGRFRIPASHGLEPGNYTVKISSMKVEPAGEPGGLPGKDPEEMIPAKYNTASTLTREIKRGDTNLTFDLD